MINKHVCSNISEKNLASMLTGVVLLAQTLIIFFKSSRIVSNTAPPGLTTKAKKEKEVYLKEGRKERKKNLRLS